MLRDGLYIERGQGHQAIVRNLRVKDGVVMDAWVYQVLGQYSEPGFEGQWKGRCVTDETLARGGYRWVCP